MSEINNKKNLLDLVEIRKQTIANIFLIFNVLLNSQATLAQNLPAETPKLTSQQEQTQQRTFKKDPNFPFPVLDMDTYLDRNLNVQLQPALPISTNIPQNPNPNFNLLLQKILTSPKVVDDGGGLYLKYDNVFGVTNQKLFLEIRLKLEKDKNGNLERGFFSSLNLNFRSTRQPTREGNFSIVFPKDGSTYVSLINVDLKVIETLKVIFGENETAEILKKAGEDNLRRYILSPEQQQKLAKALDK